MIAFDVFLNRKKLARAGVGSDGVLTAITTWVESSKKKDEMNFSIGAALFNPR